MKESKETTETPLRLFVREERLAVCQMPSDQGIPAWATSAEFFSVTRTSDETSIVCPESQVLAGTTCERGWRAIGIQGPLDFSLVGVLTGMTKPLAEAGLSVFAISTYDTDYVLVKDEQLELSTTALRGCGYEVH